jgi:hypothetical protein
MRTFFIFLLLQLFSVALAAQDTTTINFYSNNLGETYDRESKAKPLIMQHFYYKNEMQALVYQPNTNLVFFKVKAKKVAVKGQDKPFMYLPSEDFVYTKMDSSVFKYDSRKHCLSYYDRYKVLKYTNEYLLKKKDTATIVSTYYTNKNIHTIKKYKQTLLPIPLLYETNITGSGIEGSIDFSVYGYKPNEYSVNFYNGKPYLKGNVNANNSDNDRYNYYSIQFWDSSGVKLNTENYTNIKTNAPKNTWLSFFDNGKIAKEMYYSSDTLQPNSTIYYTKEKQDITLDYAPLNPKPAYVFAGRQDGNDSEYSRYYTLQNTYNYNEASISTPFFHAFFDTSHKLVNFSYIYTNDIWLKNACPPKPAPIMVGGFVGMYPDGEWLIYDADSVGNKKDLRIKANFKKGILHGQTQVWKAESKAEIADILFENGKIIRTKYKPNEGAAQGEPSPLFDYISFVLAEQDKINARNTPAAQHADYIAQRSDIWQRDTLIFLNETRDYNGENDVYRSLQKMVVTQFTPDENSLMQYTMQQMDNNTLQKTKTNLFFYKKTGLLDSISTIQSINPPYYLFYFDKKKRLFSASNNENRDNKNTTEQPNDSVLIYNTYRDALFKSKYSAQIDSFYYNENYKAIAAENYKKPYKIDFLLPKYLDSVQVWRDPKKRMTANKQHLTDFFCLNTPFYSFTPPDLRLDYNVFSRTTYRYDTLGKADAILRNNEFQPFLKVVDSLMDLMNLPNKNGEYKRHQDYNTYIFHFKNNKKYGWESIYNKTGRLENEIYYHNNKIISEKQHRYNVKSHYEAKIDSFYTETQYDTLTNSITRSYYKNNKKGVLYSINNTWHADSLFWKENPKAVIDISRIYIRDSVGKSHLVLLHKQTGIQHFEQTVFYLSGAVHVQTTSDVYAPITYNNNIDDAQKSTMEYADLNAIDIPNYTQKIVYWDNQMLREQSFGNGNFLCQYDRAGNIELEQLFKDEQSVSYLYPASYHTNNCMLDGLPYQIGKMENGHRVGEWRAYARDTSKTLLYSIMYDAEGCINGQVAVYNQAEHSARIAAVKAGKKQGFERFYKDSVVLKESFFDHNQVTNTKEFDTNKQLISETFYFKNINEAKYKITYHKNTNIPEKVYIKKAIGFIQVGDGNDYLDPYILIDSTFDTKHRLLSANIFYSSNNLSITTKKEKGKFIVKQKIYNSEVFTESEIFEMTSHKKPKKPLKKPQHRIALSDKAQKMLKGFGDNWQHFSFGKTYKNYTWSDISAKTERSETALCAADTHFEIKNKAGETIVFSSDSLICKLITQKKAENTPYNAVILPNEHYTNGYSATYDMDTNEPDITSSCYAAEKYLFLYSKTPIYFSQTFPAALLHPLNSQKPAKVLLSSTYLSLVKTYPLYYGGHNIYDLQTNANKKQVYEACEKLVSRSDELFSCLSAPQYVQQYEIGNTGIELLPLSFYFTNNLIYNPRNLQYQGQNFGWNIVNTYPHHGIKNEAGTMVADTFLRTNAFHLIATEANISFPFLKNKMIREVLLDKNELNFSLNAYEDAEIVAAHNQIISFAAKNKIDLIIKADNKVIYDSKNIQKPNTDSKIDILERIYPDAIYYFRYKLK